MFFLFDSWDVGDKAIVTKDINEAFEEAPACFKVPKKGSVVCVKEIFVDKGDIRIRLVGYPVIFGTNKNDMGWNPILFKKIKPIGKKY